MSRDLQTQTALALIAAALLAGCALVRTTAGIDDPDVWISNVSVADASFEHVDLLFDVAIKNPNNVAATLHGFNYSLLLDNLQVLNGTQETTIAIAARDSSTVPVPVTIRLADVYELYTNLRDKDEIPYALLADLNFDLPLLGRVNVPVAREGMLPIPKEPIITVEDLKVTRVGLTSADVELYLRINNPNTFDVLLDSLAYEFSVNDTQWGRGSIKERTTVNEKGETILRLPFTLDTAAMGQTFTRFLSGMEPIKYRLQGAATLDTTSSLIRHIYLPIDREGQLGAGR
jgi:LEA14-like dessication related protein